MKNQHNTNGFNLNLDTQRFETIKSYLNGKICLEVGSAEGHYTKELLKMFRFVVAIEPNKQYFKQLSKIKGFRLYKENVTFEDYNITATHMFDSIVVLNVLEHIEDVDAFLSKMSHFGHSDTTFIFSVPNSESYHRIMAKEVGLIKHTSVLGASDKQVGHKRVYSKGMLLKCLESHDFKVLIAFTSVYKPFDNKKMNKLPIDIKKYCLSKEMPDNGAEIFVICKKCGKNPHPKKGDRK